jgi:steroid delta-isomerase-like uncharacterized protein
MTETLTIEQQNLKLMRAAFEALARKDVNACMAMLDPGFKINIAGMPYQQSGHGPWRKNVETMLNAFPDLAIDIEEMIADGDIVAVRVRFRGTQTGSFLGIPPSCKTVDYQSSEFYRFADGRLTEEWICSDTLTMMTQVGAVSPAHLLLVWLGSFRLWFAAAAGGVLGAGLVLAVQALSA